MFKVWVDWTVMNGIQSSHFVGQFSLDGQLILRKISKIGATRCQISRPKCTKFDFRRGCVPNQVAAWLSGNVVGHINEVTLRRAGLMLRWVTVRGVQPSHPGQLSLVIPPWVGKMSSSDGYGYR